LSATHYRNPRPSIFVTSNRGPDEWADHVRLEPARWRAARINHLQYGEIYEVGETDDQLFMTMERLDGESAPD
jgi:hypothetical protein